METDAINRVIARVVETETDPDYYGLYIRDDVEKSRAELSALEAENAKLRGALRRIRDKIAGCDGFAQHNCLLCEEGGACAVEAWSVADAALANEPTDKVLVLPNSRRH